MSNKLPKLVYVFWENTDGEDEPFLICETDIERTVQPGQARMVGVYELKKFGTVKSEVTLVTGLKGESK